MARIESHTLEAFRNFMANVYDVTKLTPAKACDFFTMMGVTGNAEVRYNTIQTSATPMSEGRDDYNVLTLTAGSHKITLVYNRDPGFIRIAIDNRIYKEFVDRGIYWEFVPTEEFIGKLLVWIDDKTGRLCTEIETA